VIVVDMMAHGRAEYREEMGHVWQGFAEEQMRAWLAECGFTRVRWRGLAAEHGTRGPVLFAVSGVAS
jgi:ArsR family transcriptional regulator